MNYKIFILIIFAFFITGCANKELNEIFIEKAEKEKIDYKMLMSICKHESGFKEYAINVNKSIFNLQQGPHFFSSKFSANVYMDYILEPMFLSYDVGICQINNQHLKKHNLSNEDLLNKEENITIAAKIYKQNLISCKGNEKCALSMYNTGKKESTIGKKYAENVLSLKRKMFKE